MRSTGTTPLRRRPTTWLALVALLYALGTLAYQIVQAKKYWMHSLLPEPDLPESPEN